MTAKTLRALKASIRHWEEMRENPKSDVPYSDTCALCDLFLDDDCAGCPVAKRTGYLFCNHTPYHAAYGVWRNLDYRSINLTAWTEAATAEINFLKSLLPKTRTQSK